MGIKFEDYRLGYKVVSLAFDDVAKEKLLENGLSVLHVNDDSITLLPEAESLSTTSKHLENINLFNNFDVLEIWENGRCSRCYNDKTDDNFFFITGACNSNCIMCPSPKASRQNGMTVSPENLMLLAKHIPSDTPHLTITGGEPFLLGESIFEFLDYLKNKFLNTEFLFLTNGRIFAVEKYLKMFLKSMPKRSIVAIPLHGSCEAVHDGISCAPESFRQTRQGIRNLLRNNVPVELRLVVNKLNVHDFSSIADLIIKEFSTIEYVSIIAMEMTGAARANKEQVWIPYGESFALIEPAIRKLIMSEIDVRLYNFPLCTVKSAYWSLCEKSISANKVRYDSKCDECKYKASCGGVFAGTLALEKDELRTLP